MFRSILIAFVVMLTGCSEAANPPQWSTAPTSTPILVFGDSLSAAYGIDEQQGWVALLEQDLRQQQLINNNQKIANESISGETTNGGLQRLEEQLVRHQPMIVVLELGANDALRRQPLTQMKSNLQRMIDMIKEHNAQVVLVSVNLPSRFSLFVPTRSFTNVYHELAQENNIVLVPNLLEGVNNNREYMLDDGLHPNAQGQPRMKENVLQFIL